MKYFRLLPTDETPCGGDKYAPGVGFLRPVELFDLAPGMILPAVEKSPMEWVKGETWHLEGDLLKNGPGKVFARMEPSGPFPLRNAARAKRICAGQEALKLLEKAGKQLPDCDVTMRVCGREIGRILAMLEERK
jgi:hypothetical protein